MRKILTVFAIIFCGMWAITTAKAELTDFYTYTEIGAGYKVSLSAGFKVHVNKAWGGRFTSDGYTWRTGDALPNPAPDGMFNGVPVVSMDSMFYMCDSLTSLDLSSFNTSKVTDMYMMFYRCNSLTSLDLSSFNTSNVTNMRGMFYRCESLTSLDLSNFNTSNVTDMGYMFCACNSLPSLDLSNFNTSNVTDMSGMFSECVSLTSLDLSSFNTSNVTNISSMFYDCGKITNGQPAVGYAKDAATAAIFNNEWGTYINLSRLEFRAKTSGIVSENDTKNLQLRGNVLYNPTGSEIVIYTVNGQKILVSSDINIDLSSFANAAYVAQSETETIKIAL